MDINFFDWTIKCLILLGILVPFGVIMRLIVSKTILYRNINWITEGKEALREIKDVSPILYIIFVIEGVVSNFATIGVLVFTILGVIF